MGTSMPSRNRQTTYTIREAAWILGVRPEVISRAVRLGTLRAERRHGQFVIPASAIRRVLAEPISDDQEPGDTP